MGSCYFSLPKGTLAWHQMVPKGWAHGITGYPWPQETNLAYPGARSAEHPEVGGFLGFSGPVTSPLGLLPDTDPGEVPLREWKASRTFAHVDFTKLTRKTQNTFLSL